MHIRFCPPLVFELVELIVYPASPPVPGLAELVVELAEAGRRRFGTYIGTPKTSDSAFERLWRQVAAPANAADSASQVRRVRFCPPVS